MRTIRVVAVMISLACGASCGGGGSGVDAAPGDGDGGVADAGLSAGPTCQLTGSTTDGVAWSIDGEPTCVVPFSGDTGLTMIFDPSSGPVASFQIVVPAIHAGEMGTFTGSINLRTSDGSQWATPSTCEIVVNEHIRTGAAQVGARFEVVGTLTCADQATATVNPGQPVTIGSFSFRFPAHWPS